MLRAVHDKLGFEKKLLLGIFALVLVTSGIMAGVHVVQSKQSALSQGKSEIENVASGLFKTLSMHQDMLLGRTESDLSMLSAYQSVAGKPALNSVKQTELALHNPTGGGGERVTLPRLMFGVDFLTNAFVDKMASVTGARTSIYQKAGKRLVCVAISLERQGSRPEVGRCFAAGTKRYRAVLRGERFTGLEKVNGVWSMVMLKPFRGRYTEEAIGALSVARPILSQDLRDLVRSTTVGGKGSVLLFDREGSLLIGQTAGCGAGSI